MNLLRLFRQSLFSSGAACKRTLARNTRRLLPLAAVLLLAATAQAQERRTTHDNDFRARFSFALTKQLGQRHSITLDEELRLKDNWSQLDRIYTTLSYAYDVRPWFKAAAFYALIANDRGADRSMEMRHRLMAEYAVAGTGLKPYVFVELTQTLNAPETVGNYLEKVRSSLGAKYAFNKRSSLEFYYRFDYKISDEPVFDDFPTVDYISSERESHHINGLEYGYKF